MLGPGTWAGMEGPRAGGNQGGEIPMPFLPLGMNSPGKGAHATFVITKINKEKNLLKEK